MDRNRLLWRPRTALLSLGLAAVLGAGCGPALPQVGHQLFTSPQLNPILVVSDMHLLVVANTTSGTVSVHDYRELDGPDHGLRAEIPVGLDPVGLARRPDSTEVYVANYISDTISVIDLEILDVVATVQGDRDPTTGIPETDAPVGIEFYGATRAFVTLDDNNEVVVIDTDPDGSNPRVTGRLPFYAQAPRALAVVGDYVYVASFESENQTEFPTCAPDDPRLESNGGPGLMRSNPHDEGCEFATEILESVDVSLMDGDLDFGLELGTIFDFAAVNPNIGGEVIRDRDRPDRDLFIYRASDLQPVGHVEGIGTLLYGMKAVGSRLWITNTDARNDRDGLFQLGNRMFENRLSYLDCAGGACSAPVAVDLEANRFGIPVPTPYGIQAKADGSLLVVSVAGSDGIPGIAGDPGRSIPGLVTLDGQGNVLGYVQTGAIPQGLALHSWVEGGGEEMAFVLNTVDSTVSAVDLSDPENPRVWVTFKVGSDPTPETVREGRVMFSSARASTSGTFSCESCHPNGNMDQILWVINTDLAPTDYPVDAPCDVDAESCPEPRTTMPIRGLRDTLPVHWMGSLADPFQNLEGQRPQPEDAGAPDCDLAVDGEVGCMRHLVNASLSGVMCAPDPGGGCSMMGPADQPGSLSDGERDAMSAFLMAVAYPPSPARRDDDRLTELAVDNLPALEGFSDFFTDLDGLGVGSPSNDIGQAVGFAPVTCADNAGGCHSLPLTNDTNSTTVGGFDVPSMRGIWDRSVLFSNGNISSEEWMRLAQECADGNPPGGHPSVSVLGFPQPNLITGDPCALQSVLFGGGGGGGAPPLPGLGNVILDPFGVPSGEEIYRPGDPTSPVSYMTERGQFMGSFEAIFHLAYGVRGAPMWQFLNEMSLGYPGLVGRQLTLSSDTLLDPSALALLDLMERYADEGRITLVARNREHGEWRFADGLWRLVGVEGETLDSPSLLEWLALKGAVYTVTAHLPGGVSIGGGDRQILLDIDPDLRAAEMAGDVLPVPLPQPLPQPGEVIRIGVQNVASDAVVIVDGDLCTACSWVAGVAGTGDPVADVNLGPARTPGVHALQLLNPGGWMSNEMPILVVDPAAIPPPPTP
jgi:YVTN family beta-propeller protein